ncbi:MAG TPA: peptide-methionine (S)-S-oxide reductase MsrA [Firmicutes bacterium]|jgi:peptide-methionine (S)-S-oxide reductase|nr:peptide-methionine (S)-S-oxide reductase MsrA [Bacillota bacterium]
MSQATAVFGGGCFWCLEAIFSELKGVLEVLPGYSGGHVENPTYEQVCTDKTGHAEVVQISYDPDEISYEDLLRIFFSTHDPTTLNRQGEDVGTQYRSVVFYGSEAERQAAERIKEEMAPLWEDPIVTEIVPLERFWPAEDYHRNYFRLHPEKTYCSLVIAPKVAKFRKNFAERLKAR